MSGKPPGRPSQGAEVLFEARISKAEALFVQRAAECLGLSQSQFLRLLIVNTLYDWNTPTEEETPNAKR